MEAQPDDRGVTVMERLRAVHLRMVDAVLGGDGLEGVAQLAAGETGGVVAIVVPRLGAAAASGPGAELSVLRRYGGGPAPGGWPGCPGWGALGGGPPAAGPRACRRESWPRCRSRAATSSSAPCC